MGDEVTLTMGAFLSLTFLFSMVAVGQSMMADPVRVVVKLLPRRG